MVKYVAHIPHSPALVPEISKNNSAEFDLTRQAILEIAEDIYSLKTDSLVILTPKRISNNKDIALAYSSGFFADLSKFGHYQESDQYTPDSEIVWEILNNLQEKFNLKFFQQNNLDSCASTLVSQSKLFKKIKIIPISCNANDYETLFNFGKDLRNVLDNSNKKISIISLGDMSRSRNNQETEARLFDEKIINYLEYQNNFLDLISQIKNNIQKLQNYSLQTLSVSQGILKNIKYKKELLRYEQKFQVGLMASKFIF